MDSSTGMLVITLKSPAMATRQASPDVCGLLPVVPHLARAVTKVSTMATTQALLAVSWISLFFAVWGVMRLTALIFPGTKAWRSGTLLAFFPVSVFLLAGYAESLYMALVAWALVALVERRPWLAATLNRLRGGHSRRRCPVRPWPS